MGEVLRAISPEEHDAFYREIYSSGEGGLVFSQFRVSMDTDPTLNPKGINEKIAKVQGLKDRLVVIYNRAIKNKNYWDTVTKKVQARFDAAYQKAMLLDEVKKAGNAESRVAAATEKAKKAVLIEVFKGDGTYDDRISNIAAKFAEAISFFSEVKNIYENLDSTSMNLAIQLKSVMLNARIYGDGFGIEKGGNNGGGAY
jgi:hypothetical protein